MEAVMLRNLATNSPDRTKFEINRSGHARARDVEVDMHWDNLVMAYPNMIADVGERALEVRRWELASYASTHLLDIVRQVSRDPSVPDVFKPEILDRCCTCARRVYVRYASQLGDPMRSVSSFPFTGEPLAAALDAEKAFSKIPLIECCETYRDLLARGALQGLELRHAADMAVRYVRKEQPSKDEEGTAWYVLRIFADLRARMEREWRPSNEEPYLALRQEVWSLHYEATQIPIPSPKQQFANALQWVLSSFQFYQAVDSKKLSDIIPWPSVPDVNAGHRTPQ